MVLGSEVQSTSLVRLSLECPRAILAGGPQGEPRELYQITTCLQHVMQQRVLLRDLSLRGITGLGRYCGLYCCSLLQGGNNPYKLLKNSGFQHDGRGLLCPSSPWWLSYPPWARTLRRTFWWPLKFERAIFHEYGSRV